MTIRARVGAPLPSLRRTLLVTNIQLKRGQPSQNWQPTALTQDTTAPTLAFVEESRASRDPRLTGRVRERTDLSCPPTPSKPSTLTYHLRVRLAFHSAVPMTLVHLALNLCSKRRKEARRASSANLLCLGMWHSAVAGLGSTALAWPAWAWALPPAPQTEGGGRGSCILDSSFMQKADGHFQSCQCSRPSQGQELRAQSSTADEQALRTRPRPPCAELCKHCQVVPCPHRVVLSCSRDKAPTLISAHVSNLGH